MIPTVEASISSSGMFPRDGNQRCPTSNLSMSDFLHKLHREPRPHLYCHGNVMPEALLADCPLPQLLQGCTIGRRSLWISASGARSPLHYDLPNVLLCQLHGRKRVWLFSPEHHDSMRPRGTTFPALGAQERIARTTLDELSVEGMVVDLEPGDALFMPSGWFHEVNAILA